jgi:hypothetical protein
MTRSFTALAVLSLVLAIGPSSAAGVNVPAQYRGLWCFNKKATQLSRCREANDESYQYIGRNSMKMSEEGECPITSVTPTANGHRVRVRCPSGIDPNPPEHIDLWLDARGHLHIKGHYPKSLTNPIRSEP